MARFGRKALTSATFLAQKFHTTELRGFGRGWRLIQCCLYPIFPTSAIGLVLMTVAHRRGWPIPKGGSMAISNALVSYFISLGGKLETGYSA
jgi:phytoene dehydrogenase-like protein